MSIGFDAQDSARSSLSLAGPDGIALLSLMELSIYDVLILGPYIYCGQNGPSVEPVKKEVTHFRTIGKEQMPATDVHSSGSSE